MEPERGTSTNARRRVRRAELRRARRAPRSSLRSTRSISPPRSRPIVITRCRRRHSASMSSVRSRWRRASTRRCRSCVAVRRLASASWSTRTGGGALVPRGARSARSRDDRPAVFAAPRLAVGGGRGHTRSSPAKPLRPTTIPAPDAAADRARARSSPLRHRSASCSASHTMSTHGR